MFNILSCLLCDVFQEAILGCLRVELRQISTSAFLVAVLCIFILPKTLDNWEASTLFSMKHKNTIFYR